MHSLKGLPGVTDIRNLGLAAGIDMEGRKDAIGARGFDAFVEGLRARPDGAPGRPRPSPCRRRW